MFASTLDSDSSTTAPHVHGAIFDQIQFTIQANSALAESIMPPVGNQLKSVRSPLVKVPTKAPTDVAGFDEITSGGLTRGRTTLVVRGPGSDKTVLAPEFLVHGAQDRKDPDISGASSSSDRQPK